MSFKQKPNRAVIDALEGRRLLSAAGLAGGGNLVVRGTDGDDVISLVHTVPQGRPVPDGSVTVGVRVNNGPMELFDVRQDGRVTVRAGAGNDTVTIGEATLDGAEAAAPGVARLFAGIPASLRLTVDGGAGDDAIEGSGGDDVLRGGSGNDRIGGFGGDDLLVGGSGNDTLHGAAGADVLLGGAGNDVLGAVDSPGGAGTFEAEPGDDLLAGGAGDDDLRGGDGADALHGNAGADSVSGMAGADGLRGGGGPDRFYNAEAEAERLDFTPGVDELRGPPATPAESRPRLSVSLEADGVLVITGTDAADTIRVEQRVDFSSALPPSLFISGDESTDPDAPAELRAPIPSRDVRTIVIRTGGGDDNVEVTFQHYAVDTTDPNAPPVYFPTRIELGDGNDTATGGQDDDVILGGAGDDRLDGSFGLDTLIGGDGTDVLLDTGNDDLPGAAVQ